MKTLYRSSLVCISVCNERSTTMSKKSKKKSKSKKRKNGKAAKSRGPTTVIYNNNRLQSVVSNPPSSPSGSSAPASSDSNAPQTEEGSPWKWIERVFSFLTAGKAENGHALFPLSRQLLFLIITVAVCVITILSSFAPQVIPTQSQPGSSTTSASSPETTTSKTANVTINM